MRASDYGPVSVSRWKTEQPHIYDALAQGRRVLVAQRGKVVAAFVPAEELPVDVLALYALPQIETKPFEITATVMNQQRPAPGYWLKRAMADEPSLVTSSGKLYGMLRSISADELEPDGPSHTTAIEHGDAIDEFLADHPDATPHDLAMFTARLDDTATTPVTTAAEQLPTLAARVFGSDRPTDTVRKRRSKKLFLQTTRRAGATTTTAAAAILGSG